MSTDDAATLTLALNRTQRFSMWQAVLVVVLIFSAGGSLAVFTNQISKLSDNQTELTKGVKALGDHFEKHTEIANAQMAGAFQDIDGLNIAIGQISETLGALAKENEKRTAEIRATEIALARNAATQEAARDALMNIEAMLRDRQRTDTQTQPTDR